MGWEDETEEEAETEHGRPDILMRASACWCLDPESRGLLRRVEQGIRV